MARLTRREWAIRIVAVVLVLTMVTGTLYSVFASV